MKLFQDFNFPIKAYESTFQDRKSLMISVKSYLTCWLEGIPVLKIPQNMYERMFKFMWTPHVLDIEENDRVTFSPLMQIKRMKYILVDHVVYKIIDVENRNYLRSWAKTFVEICNNMANEISKNDYCTTPDYEDVSNYFEDEIFRDNINVDVNRFSIETFKQVSNEDLILHLIDFIYCLNEGIEPAKLWSFETPWHKTKIKIYREASTNSTVVDVQAPPLKLENDVLTSPTDTNVLEEEHIANVENTVCSSNEKMSSLSVSHDTFFVA